VSKEILCIDDDPGMVELIQLIMRKDGATVRGASNGAEGLAVLQDALPDLILLDIMMPEMDGWETYKQLKKNPKLKDIPVIILTARSSTFEEVIARERAGVDDYITKPFTSMELRTRIEDVFARGNQ